MEFSEKCRLAIAFVSEAGYNRQPMDKMQEILQNTTKQGGQDMRTISAQAITAEVKRLCMEANSYLPEDVKERIAESCRTEPWELARGILEIIRENYELAERQFVPICQDTGMACVFLEVGQDVHIDGPLEEAIHEGVRQGYEEGCLRKSVVRDPLDRVNTKDNTPAMIYYDIVPGDKLKITVAPKGFGSENMSRIQMLKPSDGVEGVKAFVLDAVGCACSTLRRKYIKKLLGKIARRHPL